MTPVLGSEQRYGGANQQTGRVSAPPQTPTPTPAKAQTPPATSGQGGQSGQSGQGGQRQAPSAEQFLSLGWDWWKDESVKKEMKLTDSQVRNIAQIYNSRVQYVKPFYDEYLKQRELTDRLSKERTVDVSVFEMEVIRLESLRSKVNETRTIMLYRINRILDPAQYQKLREIIERRWNGNGRGRGAPIPRTW